MRRFAVLVSVAALSACATAGEDRAVHGHAHDHGTTIHVPDLAAHHGAVQPWTSLEALDGPERFHFVVVTDRTGGEREGVFPVAVEAIDRVQPAFVMSVGDLIQGYTKDKGELNAEWDAHDADVGKLDAPFFYVVGNHDIMNTESAEVWAERLGADYYHFVYKDTLFIALNSELMVPEGSVTPDRLANDPIGITAFRADETTLAAAEAQLEYLENVLAENQTVRWTFVFLHKPYWRERWVSPPRDPETREFNLENYQVEGPWPKDMEIVPDWQKVSDLLEDRNHSVFAGHRHTYEYEDASNGPHRHDRIAMATTGGVSAMRGPSYGEFDHVMWVTMTEDGPVFANLAIDGILPLELPIPDARPYWVE